MRILSVDQSREGGYAIFDYEEKKLIHYGDFAFKSPQYSYPQAISALKSLIKDLIYEYDISAVFIEDIALRRGFIESFKRLAQLQGVLENFFIESNMVYDIIAPTMWQNYCGARSRSNSERKAALENPNTKNKKATKVFSIQFVKEQYGVETSNDGIADAIGIGHYAVNNERIIKE